MGSGSLLSPRDGFSGSDKFTVNIANSLGSAPKK